MKRFLLFWSLVPTFVHAQERLGEWKALTSILNVRDVIYTEEAIYAATGGGVFEIKDEHYSTCLLYTSPSPRDVEESRMPSSA